MDNPIYKKEIKTFRYYGFECSIFKMILKEAPFVFWFCGYVELESSNFFYKNSELINILNITFCGMRDGKWLLGIDSAHGSHICNTKKQIEEEVKFLTRQIFSLSMGTEKGKENEEPSSKNQQSIKRAKKRIERCSYNRRDSRYCKWSRYRSRDRSNA